MRLVATGLYLPMLCSQPKGPLIQMFGRLRYHDLEKLAPFSESYQEHLEQHQTA